MTTWADFAIIFGLGLLPLTGASESRTFWGPDRPWFLPNRIRTPLGLSLLLIAFFGFQYQDYPRPEDADWQWIDFLGQLGTAFSRVFGIG
ncbi:hypothetical protein [Cognatiyoonia sp. IB215182]|uniref:hypothetical protein n=1 Tax=Cognatiyoonia sp. IB215182 TaxID=3097353 RepID=UPI002A0DE97E|nr:hypothetical protein [Cognatiyoonia sp. IB215182]MDX8353555.1 hypothetical protein [Cognatiyoonia sp. IB215182]